MKIKLFTAAVATAYLLSSCGQAPKETNNSEAESEMHEEHEGNDHNHDEMHEDHEGHAQEEAKTEMLMIPENAKISFANLEDGQTVANPVKVVFGIEGMEVEAAGELNEGKGHHHIIINGSALERGVVVPADSLNIHYGKGQTETELTLPAGEHTLTLQFADGYHQSYGPQLSETISIVVE